MPATIYFVVSEEMSAKNGMPEKEKAGTFGYVLKNGTFFNFYVAESAGKLFDVVREHTKDPFAICRAIVSDIDIAAAVTCAVTGDTYSFDVIVDEVTWINK